MLAFFLPVSKGGKGGERLAEKRAVGHAPAACSAAICQRSEPTKVLQQWKPALGSVFDSPHSPLPDVSVFQIRRHFLSSILHLLGGTQYARLIRGSRSPALSELLLVQRQQPVTFWAYLALQPTRSPK
jgi:hypothetical protein